LRGFALKYSEKGSPRLHIGVNVRVCLGFDSDARYYCVGKTEIHREAVGVYYTYGHGSHLKEL
jgi:hypothetical protein